MSDTFPTIGHALDDVRPFLDEGFAIHLLKKRSKAPLHNGWSDRPRATEDELEDDYREGMNVGVRLGKPSVVENMYLHVIDLDIRDDDYADEAHEALSEMFPDVNFNRLPTVQSGSGGESRHYYFLTQDPFRSKKLAHSEDKFEDEDGHTHWCWEIELFGTGKQVAMPPSIHPDTGKRYRWLVEVDWLVGIPTIDSEVLSDLVHVDEDYDHDNHEPLGLTLEDADDALPWVSDWADDYETWRNTGMALKHEFGDAAYPLFDQFSQQSKSYNKHKNRMLWNKFKNDRDNLITMRTVMLEVHRRKIVQEFADMEEDDEDDQFDPDVDDKTASDSKELGVPKHLLKIPGALQGVADYYNATALVDQPQFAIQAALAYGSVVLSRNWRTNYAKPNYSSLYLICVGDTGAGKESVKDAVEDILTAANLDTFIGPRDYTSEGALMGKLMKHPKHVAFIDELGKKLGDDRKGHSSSHKDGVYTAYTELFTKLHSTYHGTAMSQNNKTKEEADALDQRKIERPALTLVGLTPPEVFYGAINDSDVSSGFLNRFLVIQSRSDPFQPQRVFVPPTEPPQSVLDWTEKYVMEAEDFEDMMAAHDPQTFLEFPAIVPFTQKAWELLEQIERERTDLRREYHQYGLMKLFSRTREIAMRIALIVALSEESKVIRYRHLSWAWDYVKFYQCQTAEAFRANVGKSELRMIADDLAEYIKAKGKVGVPEGRMSNDRPNYGNLFERDKEQVRYFLRDLHGIIAHKTARSSGKYIHPKFLKGRT